MNQLIIEDLNVNNLKDLIGQWKADKIFLVTGKKAYAKSGAQALIEASFEGRDYVRYYDFEQNPKFEDVLKGTSLFQDSGCDIIVAIGGGSVIDMAKLINAFSSHKDKDYLDIVKGLQPLSRKGKRLLAIPTTAGTGSEATHFAVVYHEKKKYSVAHSNLLPDAVGFQAALTMSQSPYLTACAAMDAFSQAMESYWSVGRTAESAAYAIKALKILTTQMAKGVNNPDLECRSDLLKAAYYAGCAINISKTTAAHAVSYAFTTFYGIPHGHAVFLTLPKFLEYNYGVTEDDINDPGGVDIVKARIMDLCRLLGVSSPREAKIKIYSMAREMRVELSASALGMEDFEEKVAENVNTERLGNNPRMISKEGLINLLKAD